MNQLVAKYREETERHEAKVLAREVAIRAAGIACPYCNGPLEPERNLMFFVAARCAVCHALFNADTRHWIEGNFHGTCSKCGKEVWGNYGACNGKVYHSLPDCGDGIQPRPANAPAAHPVTPKVAEKIRLARQLPIASDDNLQPCPACGARRLHVLEKKIGPKQETVKHCLACGFKET